MMSHANNVVIGFDYGTKKIGVAIGQSQFATAQALTTIPVIKHLPQAQALNKVIEEWQPQLAIIGLPATASKPFTKRIKQFQQYLLTHYSLDSLLVDETLTTEQANFELYEMGTKAHRKGTQRDAIAARLILETYFSTR